MHTPVSLSLHDSSGDPVVAEVTAIDRDASGAWVATFHVTLEVWTHINAEELFHTQRDRRVGRVAGDFEHGRPIVIEAALDDLVAKTLQLADASADDVLARLAAIKPNTLDQFLLSTRSWFARSVVQEVPLPDELKAKGSISEGFRMRD